MSPGVAGHADARLPAAQRRAFWVGLLIGVPVSAVFLALAVRKVDLDAMRDAITGASIPLVLGGVAALAGVYVLQAARWRAVAETASVPRRRFLEFVVSGVAVNNVLPGRLGDFLRARWLSVAAEIPGGRAFATVVLDRGSDVVVLAAFLVVSLSFVADTPWLTELLIGALGLLLVFIALLAFSRVYARTRSRHRRDHRGLFRRLVRDTVEGLARPITARFGGIVLGFSLAAWSLWALGAWMVARAIGIELSPLEVVLITAVVNLGVAIPSSPGFVGTYQWLAVSTLGLFEVPRHEALAFSILLHGAWYVPTTIVGAALLLRRWLRVWGSRDRGSPSDSPAG